MLLIFTLYYTNVGLQEKHQALLDFYRNILFSLFLRAIAYTDYFQGFIIWDSVSSFQWYTRKGENRLCGEQFNSPNCTELDIVSNSVLCLKTFSIASVFKIMEKLEYILSKRKSCFPTVITNIRKGKVFKCSLNSFEKSNHLKIRY